MEECHLERLKGSIKHRAKTYTRWMNHDVQFVHTEQWREGRQNMEIELACVSNTPSQTLAQSHPLMGVILLLSTPVVAMCFGECYGYSFVYGSVCAPFICLCLPFALWCLIHCAWAEALAGNPKTTHLIPVNVFQLAEDCGSQHCHWV